MRITRGDGYGRRLSPPETVVTENLDIETEGITPMTMKNGEAIEVPSDGLLIVDAGARLEDVLFPNDPTIRWTCL